MNRALFLCTVLAGCNATTSSAPPAASESPTEEASRASNVKRDCAHLRELGCAASKPTPHGHVCEEVETAEADAGIPMPWACRLKATTCAEVDNCKVP